MFTLTATPSSPTHVLRYAGNVYTLADDGTTLLAAPILRDDTIDWDALAEVDVVSFDAEEASYQDEEN